MRCRVAKQLAETCLLKLSAKAEGEPCLGFADVTNNYMTSTCLLFGCVTIMVTIYDQVNKILETQT